MPPPRNALKESSPAANSSPKRRDRSAQRSRSPPARKSPSTGLEKAAGRHSRTREQTRDRTRERTRDRARREREEPWDRDSAPQSSNGWGSLEPPSDRRGHRRGGKGGKSQNGFDCGRVYIGDLPDDVTEAILLRRFEMYGDVLGLKILPGRSGRSRAAAIIRYSAPAAAESAIAALKDKLDIRRAKPNPRWDLQ
mmetsp:Transcript_33467/g.77766  ORF Transcript_33467/g.77766 Transcript_33467/m.77766 type:complete len:195 (-) Transcript_33467:42-626(-)